MTDAGEPLATIKTIPAGARARPFTPHRCKSTGLVDSIQSRFPHGAWLQRCHRDAVVDVLKDCQPGPPDSEDARILEDYAAQVATEVDLTDVSPEGLLPPDLLAWYVSFCCAWDAGGDDDWGIVVNVPLLLHFAMRTAAAAGVAFEEALAECWQFLWGHEANHYEVDLARLAVEQFGPAPPTSILKPRSSALLSVTCEDEEALGQTRGLARVTAPEVRRAIADRYRASRLLGYSDVYRWKGKEGLGFETILSHYRAGSCTQAAGGPAPDHPVAGRSIRVRHNDAVFQPRHVPITLAFPLRAPQAAAPGAPGTNELIRVTVTPLHRKARKDLKDLPSDLRRKVTQLLKQIEDPNAQAQLSDLGKFYRLAGSEDLWSIHLDHGRRILVSISRDGEALVLAIGNDVYTH